MEEKNNIDLLSEADQLIQSMRASLTGTFQSKIDGAVKNIGIVIERLSAPTPIVELTNVTITTNPAEGETPNA